MEKKTQKNYNFFSFFFFHDCAPLILFVDVLVVFVFVVVVVVFIPLIALLLTLETPFTKSIDLV